MQSALSPPAFPTTRMRVELHRGRLDVNHCNTCSTTLILCEKDRRPSIRSRPPARQGGPGSDWTGGALHPPGLKPSIGFAQHSTIRFGFGFGFLPPFGLVLGLPHSRSIQKPSQVSVGGSLVEALQEPRGSLR